MEEVVAADIASWAAVAGAGAAAIAAVASWAAVRQAGKQWRLSQLPDLQLDAIINGTTHEISLQAHNGSTALARRVTLFLVQEGVCVVASPPDHASISPGQTVQASTGVRGEPGAPVAAAALCNDFLGRTHGWTLSGQHKVWSRRKLSRRNLSNVDVLRELLPDAPFDATALQYAPGWKVLP